MVISIIEYILQKVNSIVEYFLYKLEVIYTIYKKIKEICMKKGMSIRALERKTELGNGTISGWSKRNPTIENLKKVAVALDVSISELIEEEGEGV